MFDRRYARPLGHYAPLPARRAWKALTALFGKDEYSYFGLAPSDPARAAAELPPPEPNPVPVPVDPGAEVLVCLHLHYPELWPEFEAFLKAYMPRAGAGSDPAWGLIVTLTPDAAGLAGAISTAFPGAAVEVMDNRGRDIGPFFELLHRGALDRAKAICKLHGKRSVTDKRPQALGELWRRSALRSLLADSGAVIAALTGDTPAYIAAGPAHLLAPSSRISEKSAWAGRRREVEAWAEVMGIEGPRIRFFAGSMLWLGRPCLEPLRKLGLSLRDFEPEAELSIHGATYTGERIFLIAAEAVRGRIAMLSPDGYIEDIVL